VCNKGRSAASSASYPASLLAVQAFVPVRFAVHQRCRFCRRTCVNQSHRDFSDGGDGGKSLMTTDAQRQSRSVPALMDVEVVKVVEWTKVSI
jgi:hypothetical protein